MLIFTAFSFYIIQDTIQMVAAIIILSLLVLCFLALVVYLSVRDAKNEVEDIRKFDDKEPES